jgi:CYTH domain-containing protein
MGKEIERKFLLKNNDWRTGATGTVFCQGYLSTVKERTVRVRIAGDQAFLTIKGLPQGIARSEFEYEIPLVDAKTMLDELCERPFIEKTRYRIEHAGLVWEVDEFSGANTGLIIAEVELDDAHQTVDLPAWIGAEVSGDPRYSNSNLVKHPYSSW